MFGHLILFSCEYLLMVALSRSHCSRRDVIYISTLLSPGSVFIGAWHAELLKLQLSCYEEFKSL